jgi:hypothetical protein
LAQRLEAEEMEVSGEPLLTGPGDGMLAFHSDVHFSQVVAIEAQFASRPAPTEEAIVALVPEIAAGFRALGWKTKMSAEADHAARCLEEAARSGGTNTLLCAHAVINRGINLYTQEQNGPYKVGFLYKTLNARLRGPKEIQSGSYGTVLPVLKEACGELWPFAELLWEGLKLMLPTHDEFLYRGARVAKGVVERYRGCVGRELVFPAFSSFTLDLKVALSFPPQNPQQPNQGRTRSTCCSSFGNTTDRRSWA